MSASVSKLDTMNVFVAKCSFRNFANDLHWPLSPDSTAGFTVIAEYDSH